MSAPESLPLDMIPVPEVVPGDAVVPSLDGSRIAIWRMREGEHHWTLMAQYERVGDVMISVGTL